MTDIAKPFISFVVFAYNQNRFIRDAVEGAFSQQCAPMEIILSDDCSTDDTFSIMQGMANTYSGPHEVVVRRNEANLGLISHINKVFQIARGEWIVVAAGDDISMPNRVDEITRVIGEYPHVNMISSEIINFGKSHGKEPGILERESSINRRSARTLLVDIEGWMSGESPISHGATLAYSKKLIEKFPRMPKDAVYEDTIYSFRSALLGSRAHIEMPLVMYRIHEDQTTNLYSEMSGAAQKRMRLAKGIYIACLLRVQDYKELAVNFDKCLDEELRRILEKDVKNEYIKYIMYSKCWPIRIIIFTMALIFLRPILSSMSLRDIAIIIIPRKILDFL